MSVLSEHELKTSVWLKLKAHYEKRLDVFRRQNDGNITHEQTQKLRGQIAECRAFLAIGEPEQKIAVEPHID